MIDPALVAAFRNEISQARSVLIGAHLNPDGDALGSALAVSHYLDDLGVANEVLCHHAPPRNLRFLPGVDRIRQVPTRSAFDLGIIVDLDSTERLGSTAEYFETCERTVVVDHHVPQHAPGDLRIVDVEAPATAVILCRLMIGLEAPISPEIATCLLTGIVTDTGSFRFRNTTAEALSLSAMLLDHGGDIGTIGEEIFQSKTLGSVRLLGRVLGNMQLESEDRIAWSALTFDDFQDSEASDEDTEGFVNELLAIDTVKIAALLRESKPGRTRVSLRARREYDVAAVARVFGGGGHVNAAGCTFETTPAEAAEQLVLEMRHCLVSS